MSNKSCLLCPYGKSVTSWAYPILLQRDTTSQLPNFANSRLQWSKIDKHLISTIFKIPIMGHIFINNKSKFILFN